MTSAPRGNMREQKDTLHYIPFEKGLKTLLKNPEIYDEVSTMAMVYYVFFSLHRHRSFSRTCSWITICDFCDLKVITCSGLALMHCNYVF